MIRVRQVVVNVDESTEQNIKTALVHKLKIKEEQIVSYQIHKESIDAREKPNLYFIYEIDVSLKEEEQFLKKNKCRDILKTPKEEYSFCPTGTLDLKNRPVIVGAGPAGLFATYMLASEGYKPILIERGKCVEERKKDVEQFWKTGILNPSSNVQFGEGGAGTFSDGKLNTLIKDKENRMKFVFEVFVKNGASKEILIQNKPHIGTDKLFSILQNIRKEILSFGGEIRYNTCLTDILIKNNKVEGIVVNGKEEIKTNVLVLAIGHSSRDTFKMLYEKNLSMEAKPFAVGVRIQHAQEEINKSQYGVKKHKTIKEASYKLTYHATNGRGVYTFCMCPGGYVVNAASEIGHLAINGMSNARRDSTVANSAIVVTVSPTDFGTHPLDGIAFQRKLEKKAYELGEGKIPVQCFKDFKENRLDKQEITCAQFKGKVHFANLKELFPEFISHALIEGIENFGRKIEGFNKDNVLLAAVESRTSSPVRILRNEVGEANIEGIYPSGEGAGYAGGITSAAMDGIKTYECIAKKYRRF